MGRYEEERALEHMKTMCKSFLSVAEKVAEEKDQAACQAFFDQGQIDHLHGELAKSLGNYSRVETIIDQILEKVKDDLRKLLAEHNELVQEKKSLLEGVARLKVIMEESSKNHNRPRLPGFLAEAIEIANRLKTILKQGVSIVDLEESTQTSLRKAVKEVARII